MWEELEELNNESFPNCIKSLLTHAGYSSMMSLETFDEMKIKRAEDFLNKNKQFMGELDCCHSQYYKELEVFEFIPGHKSIILELPKQIKELRKFKQTKTTALGEQLKKNLIEKMMEYLQENSPKGNEYVEGTISEANIQDFHPHTKGNAKWKCFFSCPFCPKKYSVLYTKTWEASNATRHLNKHIQP